MTTILNSQATTVVNEYVIGEAAYPGHVVFLNSATKFMKNATPGANIQALVLIEDNLQGKDYTQAYANGDRARAAVLRSGDRAYFRLVATYTGAVGAFLEFGAGGQVQAVTTGTAKLIALQAIGSSATADDLILCEVL